MWYAPVLLQRKKALERGTWRVAAQPPAGALRRAIGDAAGASQTETSDPAHADSPGAANSGGLPCKKCGGSGSTVAPGGMSARLCEFGAFLRRYVKKA